MSEKYTRAWLNVVELELDDSGELSRVKMLPWGEVQLRDAQLREAFDMPGAFLVNERTAAELPQAFESLDIKPHVNFEHLRGPAAGWIEGAEVEAGEGVFGMIDWTSLGADAVRSKQYLYGSAEVVYDRTPYDLHGAPAPIVAVTGFALTNNPAVVGMEPVTFTSLTAALAAQESPKGGEKGKGEEMSEKNIFRALFARASGKELHDESDAALAAVEVEAMRKEHATLAEQVPKLQSEITELKAALKARDQQIVELTAGQREAAAEQLVADLVADGRACPAQAESLTKLAIESPDAFAALADTLQPGTFEPPKSQLKNTEDGADVADLAPARITREAIAARAKADGIDYKAAFVALAKEQKGGAG